MKTFIFLTFITFSAFGQTTYQDVSTIFQNKCLACHNSSHGHGGVNLEGYNEILDYVVSGEPDQSDLWIAIASGMMPMNGSLSKEEKATIKRWIVDGLPFGKNADN